MIFKLDFPFKASLKQTNLVAKADFNNAVSSLDNAVSSIATNKTKNESLENELKNLKNI